MKSLYLHCRSLLIAGILGFSFPVLVICTNAQPKSTKYFSSLHLLARVRNFNAGVLRFSPDGKMLANGTPGIIQIWDTRSWKLLRTLRNEKIASPFAFSPNGKTICICTTSNQVQIWNIGTAGPVRTFAGFRTHVYFSSDGTLMAGWSMKGGKVEEGTKIWDARTGRRLHAIENITSGSDQYVFSRDNKVLIIASVDNFIKIYSVRTGQLISDKDAYGDVSPPIVLSPDGKLFATLAIGGLVGDDPMPGSDVRPATDGGLPVAYSAEIWDAHTGKLIRKFGYWENWQSTTAPLGFTADNQKVIYCTGDYGRKNVQGGKWLPVSVIIFDVATGKELKVIGIPDMLRFNRLQLSSDCRFLLGIGTDLTVWAMP